MAENPPTIYNRNRISSKFLRSGCNLTARGYVGIGYNGGNAEAVVMGLGHSFVKQPTPERL